MALISFEKVLKILETILVILNAALRSITGDSDYSEDKTV